MKSAVETVSPTRVRLSVEVPFEELEPSLRKAYRTISGQVRVPGFRPGKVPSRVIDQRVGREVVLAEAIQEAIPEHYLAAVREHSVNAIGRPDFGEPAFGDGKPLTFTAEVDVRPRIELPELTTLRATVDAVTVTDEEVAEQIGALRDRFATLKGVDRAAQVGDYLSIDLAATADGEEVPGGSAKSISYELGSKQLLDGLDDALLGMRADESTSFTTTLVGGERVGQDAEVAVTVRGVREKELPPLDDSFAELASEFDTLEDLQTDMRERLTKMAKLRQAYQARDRALDALLDAVEVPVPAAVAAESAERRKLAVTDQLERMGATLERYLSSEGKSEQELDAELATSAEQEVRTQLLLDALAEAEQLSVSDQDLTQEVVQRARASDISPQTYADQLAKSGQLGALVADIRRSNALALLVDRLVITDSEGAPVDLSAVREPEATGVTTEE